MARILLIGSGNPDKARELQLLLTDTPWVVKDLSAYPPVDEPEENETTFEGNALLKARYYAAAHDVACVADDSGLEVDSLGGAPGVYSARYGGAHCSYDDNNVKLLDALKDCGGVTRRARFVCCAAFVNGDGSVYGTRGTVEGTIATECRGSHGFGYDPLFVPEGYTQSFGEMRHEEKYAISHRSRAFGTMRDWLTKQL